MQQGVVLLRLSASRAATALLTSHIQKIDRCLFLRLSLGLAPSHQKSVFVGRGGFVVGDMLGFFLEEHFKDSHKRWLSLCCQSSSCLEVCGRVKARQNSSSFRNTYPDTDLQGRCYFHLDIFPLAPLPPSSVATVALVGVACSTCKVPWDNSEQSRVSIPCD